MAAWASASLPIPTKPKPLERPVSRSIITLALVTAPNWLNACSRSLSRTPYGKLPTYSLLPMQGLLENTKKGRSDGSRDADLHVHEAGHRTLPQPLVWD